MSTAATTSWTSGRMIEDSGSQHTGTENIPMLCRETVRAGAGEGSRGLRCRRLLRDREESTLKVDLTYGARERVSTTRRLRCWWARHRRGGEVSGPDAYQNLPRLTRPHSARSRFGAMIGHRSPPAVDLPTAASTFLTRRTPDDEDDERCRRHAFGGSLETAQVPIQGPLTVASSSRCELGGIIARPLSIGCI